MSRFLLDIQAANQESESQKAGLSSHLGEHPGSLIFATTFGTQINSEDISNYQCEGSEDEGEAGNVESVHE